MPFEITRVTEFDRFERIFVRLDLLVIGGRAAGYPAARLAPRGAVFPLARKLGFTWKIRMDSPYDLLNLQFAGLAVPSESEDITFDRYACTSAMLRHNKALIRQLPREDEEDGM